MNPNTKTVHEAWKYHILESKWEEQRQKFFLQYFIFLMSALGFLNKVEKTLEVKKKSINN